MLKKMTRLPLVVSLALAVLAAASTAAQATTAASCAKSNLPLHTHGVLTVATDSPAYPPYFENNDPSNGKGLESAVAYAVAKQLGFSASQVKWVVEPFDSSYAPGPKNFDFDINEISITPARAKAVDFSLPYYSNPLGVIVMKKGPYAHVTSFAQLKGATFGVQVGTTSLQAITQLIDPSHQPSVYNTSSDVVQAFKVGQVQAIVTDLATDFDLVQTELPKATIAGQFSVPGGGDHWGLLLAKGSKLTACVNRALTTLSKNGTLAAINKRWIASAASVPVLK